MLCALEARAGIEVDALDARAQLQPALRTGAPRQHLRVHDDRAASRTADDLVVSHHPWVARAFRGDAAGAGRRAGLALRAHVIGTRRRRAAIAIIVLISTLAVLAIGHGKTLR
jgi:hypothetical protein